MSINLADDSQYPARFLPVVSPRQGLGIGVAGKRGYREQSLEEASQNPSFTTLAAEDDFRKTQDVTQQQQAFSSFDYKGRQSYERTFGHAGNTFDIAPAEVAAIYQENSEAAFQPFYLGLAVDLVG